MRTVAAGLVAVALAGCGAGDVGGSRGAADSLAGRTFLSRSVTEGGRPRPLVPRTEVYLEFEKGGDELSASAGCNTLTAPYRVEDGRIVVTELSMTEIGCEPAVQAQDDWLVGLVQARPAYRLDGDRLRLTAGDTTVELLDRKAADPDRPLAGTDWQVEAVSDGEVVGSVPGDARAVVRVDGDRVTVRVERCNEGSGEVEIRDGTLRVRRLVMTTRRCDREVEAVESAVVRVLDGTVRYEVEASQLELTHRDGHGLTLRAR